MTVVATVTLNPCIDRTFRVEHVVPDRKLRGREARDYPGGGGVNVARAATRLGAVVRACLSAGGETGTRLGRFLEEERITNVPVPIEGSVRENLIITDESSGHQYRFGMPGPALTAQERARWVDQVANLPETTNYVVFSGSLPDDTPVEWYERLLRAVPSQVRVVIDAKRAALSRALQVGVFLIKPNLGELAELEEVEMTDDRVIEQTARRIVERGGCQNVLVSLGRGGCLLVSADRAVKYSAPSVALRSKVGAGDSMVGGVLAGLARGQPLVEAARLGVAAGTASVMEEGTRLCNRENVERLLPCVAPQQIPSGAHRSR